MTNSETKTAKVEPESAIPAWLETVRAQVSSLKFGQVQIVVHDARVVQIERVEKFRFDAKAGRSGATQ
jgi:hypothetical protein